MRKNVDNAIGEVRIWNVDLTFIFTGLIFNSLPNANPESSGSLVSSWSPGKTLAGNQNNFFFLNFYFLFGCPATALLYCRNSAVKKMPVPSCLSCWPKSLRTLDMRLAQCLVQKLSTVPYFSVGFSRLTHFN